MRLAVAALSLTRIGNGSAGIRATVLWRSRARRRRDRKRCFSTCGPFAQRAIEKAVLTDVTPAILPPVWVRAILRAKATGGRDRRRCLLPCVRVRSASFVSRTSVEGTRRTSGPHPEQTYLIVIFSKPSPPAAIAERPALAPFISRM